MYMDHFQAYVTMPVGSVELVPKRIFAHLDAQNSQNINAVCVHSATQSVKTMKKKYVP